MKFFLRLLALLGVLGVIAIIIVGMSLNALVKTGVETMGPKVLGVPITLEDVDISLLSGGKDMRASLERLIIKNPAGYETDYAFSLPNIRVQVDRNSVLTDTIIIEEILIAGPAITFEGSLLGSNLGDIQDNVKHNTASASDDETEKKGEQHEDREKTVHIKKVTMKDAKINLSLFGGEAEMIELTLPDFELRDIGNKPGGTSFQKASAEIFDAIYAAIIKAVTESGKLIPKSLKQFGKTAEELGKSAEKVGKELLKGLFNNK
ncbi:hypothetical protein [Candidatus Nitronereus thalassa]|uniref:AsmA domain-containing protein n=1 Tax=Candidatus Nitronereus thalassa TaxID=3020898 RepID=A0ABU3K8D5_9BACT|nr:hypothetical protein [Candidatus Nitronereus thalassa]MDT7042624.1 hypothetical protein [Candidatus Nitronereus thalassa]